MHCWCHKKTLVKKRFTRMIPTVKKLSYLQWLAKLSLWRLKDRRVRADIIEVYTIIHGLLTVDFNSFFEFCHHDRTRGHSLKLQKNRVITDLRRHFFSERIVNIWNRLDEDVVSAPSINSLKNKLNKLYTDESFPGLCKSAWLQGPSQSAWEGPHWWVTGESGDLRLLDNFVPCRDIL